jgi:hypothetical protein
MTWQEEVKKVVAENPGKSLTTLLPIAKQRWAAQKKSMGVAMKPVAKAKGVKKASSKKRSNKRKTKKRTGKKKGSKKRTIRRKSGKKK